jgi:tetratricopeptide (TPR) repeat protein
VELTETAAQESFRMGEKIFHSGSYFEAARYYRRAWNLDPSLHRALVYIGDCCFRLRKFFTALQFFMEGLTHDRTFHLTWMMAGDAYFRLGRPELAQKFFSQALSLNPTNPKLKESVETIPRAASSIERFFSQQLAPADQWTDMLDQYRTAAFVNDLRETTEISWTRVLFFYREFLNPARFARLERALDVILALPAAKERPDMSQGVLAKKALLDCVRPKIASLAQFAGPPRRYRFDAADGAPQLGPVAVLKKIAERQKLLEDKSLKGQDAELKALRLKGFEMLRDVLRKTGKNETANSLALDFTLALGEAFAEKDFERSQIIAFAEMELMMSFSTKGLAESETLPSGEGISEGAESMDSDRLMEAVKFVQDESTTPEQVVREAATRQWHVESILSALLFLDPQLYVLYAPDYQKAYDLSRKMVALADLLPQHFRRFPLRGFYVLQSLTCLQEAASKLGLYEQTIQAGDRIAAVIDEMGPDWRVDLPQHPASLMRLGMASLPEKILERSLTLQAGAFRALGNPTGADSVSAKLAQLPYARLIERGDLAPADCLSLTEQLQDSDDGLDSAIYYAYAALSMDERKYREAGVQFRANRLLAGIADDLGLPRLQAVHLFRALAAAVEMDIPFNILFCFDNLGAALENRQDFSGAEYFYRKAIARIEPQKVLQKSMITTRAAIHSLFRLGKMLAQTAPQDARATLERAIDVIETQRAAIVDDLNGAGFGQAGSEIYAELIDLNLEILKDKQAAFAMLERSKMRALLDQFARRSASEQQAHPPAALEQIRRVLAVQ